MSKYHYVYHSYEEWGRDYIGVRSCDCLPEEDTKYFGSFYDKTFKPTGKTILFVCETRKEATEIEIKLHDFFDVAVNSKFSNKSKQTSTKFDTTGIPTTEETKRKQSEANSGKTRTEEQNRKYSEAKSGENNPMYGVPRTEEWKKAHSERMSGENHPQYGRTGALHHSSKAMIAIEPDGTERHYGSIHEAAKDLENAPGVFSYLLKNGHVSIRGKFKGWKFIYKNSEVLN